MSGAQTSLDWLRAGVASGDIVCGPKVLAELEAKISAQLADKVAATEAPTVTGRLVVPTPEQQRGTSGPASISFEDYAAIDAVNWSTLKAMRESPLRYQYLCTAPLEDRDVFRLGRATHTAVLEPDRFLLDYVVWQEGRRAGKKWDAFCELHASKTILTEAQYAEALAIRDAVRGHELAAPLLAAGKAEQSITWTDAATGVRCKARLDWLRAELLVDLKTSRTIDTRRFGKIAHALGYTGQVALYCDGVEAVIGQRPDVKLIVVESDPPHDVAVVRVTEDELYAGQEEYRQHLARVKECRAAGRWPGRYAEEQPLELPRWAFPEDDEIGADLGLNIEGA